MENILKHALNGNGCFGKVTFAWYKGTGYFFVGIVGRTICNGGIIFMGFICVRVLAAVCFKFLFSVKN